MKKRMICAILAVMLTLAVTPSAFGEAAVYYVNPDGGAYYHAKRDCVTVREKYREGMVEISEDQLTEMLYTQLQPCNRCMGEKSTVDIPDGTMSFRYQSSYDTAEPDVDYPAGSYRAGESIAPGVYTAEVAAKCDGELRILDGKNQPVQTFSLTGETSLSFYLAEGMSVEIPQSCVIRKIDYATRFQAVEERVVIPHARYMVMVEMPGRQYAVEAIEGTEGHCVVSDIAGNILQEVKLSAGRTAELDLGELYDVFVEFVNCVVWPTEANEG